MSESSGRLVGDMKWLVTRYPKTPCTLIALGAILTDPEDPETRLNRKGASGVTEPTVPKNNGNGGGTASTDPKEPEIQVNENGAIDLTGEYIQDESAAVQRTIHAEVHKDDSVLFKVAQPLLGASLSVDGKLKKDRKTVVEALDVNAKVLLPSDDYMEKSIKIPAVQKHLKSIFYSKKLYMIIGVATAHKLDIEEETARETSFGVNASAPIPGAAGTDMTAEGHHYRSRNAASRLKIEDKVDFAYRIRQFTYWKHRKNKVKMGEDRTKGALFRAGNDDNDGDSDDDDDNFEAVFNEMKDADVSGSGLVIFGV
jgi:hypothetical protein